jgi:hypothetical protein
LNLNYIFFQFEEICFFSLYNCYFLYFVLVQDAILLTSERSPFLWSPIWRIAMYVSPLISLSVASLSLSLSLSHSLIVWFIIFCVVEALCCSNNTQN